MAYESSNETDPRLSTTTMVASNVTNHDDVLFSYLQKLVTSTFRPSVHPVVLMGSHESRRSGEIVENFRASVVGWDVLDASEMFFVSPQEGTDRKSALMAVIRLVEKEAHKRMAELEAKIADPL
ncbi:unnamed protein product [Alternaria sp. RS040]